ncbi:excinuclease ABC subunit UvrC [Vampirovibrio sp.]|uniref:excinuclease ABC subunit UvrC n=1 Tax=Vampirovibrio sp. TaxID=2717857 RepID=UPI0035931D5A
MPSSTHPNFDFKAALARLPDQPGVYRMYSANNTLLYVGKAKVLKNRVRSYFQNPAGLAPKVAALMQQVTRFDYIVTDSEIEALILEYNLIKQHRPKYNILLRDDKKFPWIGLSAEPYPRLFITRDPTGRGRFFGPYAHSGSMYKTLQVIRKHFPLRQRRKPLFKNRPCMNYSIGSCSGPCQLLVTPKEYSEVVKQVELFLKGKADDLLERLEQEMQRASEAMNFELAAKLRDRYLAVQEVVAQQKMYYPDASVSQDIVAMSHDARRCAIVVLNIRRGKLIGSRPHEILLTHQTTPEEAYNAFLSQYYQDEEAEDLPDEIILHHPMEDENLFQEWLNRKRGKKLTLTHPQKGIKRDLLDLGIKNATETLEQAQSQDEKSHRNDPAKALLQLQSALNLPVFPARMECYDISHFQGAQTVASMVVFTNGVPDRKAYRRFKIQIAEGEPNDFASMHEVISRRFNRAIQQEPGWEEPDLVIIDGGKGQLSSATEALDVLGVKDQPIISLAKKFEEIYFPGESRPTLLPRDSAALFLLQQIRDEAHRFAITYHRGLRDKRATHSVLDDIPGIGEKRKQKLMSHFGSISNIKAASAQELAAISGFNDTVAQSIYEALHQ